MGTVAILAQGGVRVERYFWQAIMADRKAVIKNADMAEDMQQDAIDCATQALEKYNPTWHAIVGRNFGSYVTHETKHFIYFYLGQVAILLFKSGRLPRGRDRRVLIRPRTAE